MTEVLLTGLDGKNPLGLLAALGALEVLSERVNAEASEPRLVWHVGTTYTPALVNALTKDEVAAILMQDAASFRDEPAVELRYEKAGGSTAHDLKPPPHRFAEHLRALVDRGARRSLDIVAALATDVATDNNGNTKPTALHFTAGQQEFLAMVEELRDGLAAADFDEALFGPWRYDRPLPIFQWDNSSARDYALRAGDPAKEKKRGVPGAEWLAFRGLPFLRVAPVDSRTRIATTGCIGGWKSGSFRWPLWTVPLTRAAIRSLVTSPELFDLEPRHMKARGVAVVLESSIRRSDQGGYGSFTPARLAERAALG